MPGDRRKQSTWSWHCLTGDTGIFHLYCFLFITYTQVSSLVMIFFIKFRTALLYSSNSHGTQRWFSFWTEVRNVYKFHSNMVHAKIVSQIWMQWTEWNLHFTLNLSNCYSTISIPNQQNLLIVPGFLLIESLLDCSVYMTENRVCFFIATLTPYFT